MVFGLRPLPAILGATIQHHLKLQKQSEPEIFRLLEQSFYEDDLLTGESNDEKTLVIYHRAKKLIAEGGFNLGMCKTNSLKLQRAIAAECLTKSICASSDNREDYESYAKSNTLGLIANTPVDEDTFVKVLGMNWNTHDDEIIFSFTELYNYASSLLLTKRSVLKVTAKAYDPMGLLSRYFARQPVDIQLHGFSDASERAYAAVVYIRSTYSDGQVEVRLQASKSRVASIKRQTIPRLELLGALMLARLINKLESPTVLWTDSMTTLCWIQNERVWKQCVGQRVDEIRPLTHRDSWRH